jgi:alkylated DNA repair dioxygenase AlkB
MPHAFLQHSLFADGSPVISGLRHLPDFINAKTEAALIATIDQQPWLNDLKRRVQHYGWRYDYKARGIGQDLRIGAIPDWLAGLCERLSAEGIFSHTPDQVIINEYQPGQGISAHVDCVPCFGDTIASLSLSSACVMDFTHANTGEKQSHLLEPRSLLVLSGDAGTTPYPLANPINGMAKRSHARAVFR